MLPDIDKLLVQFIFRLTFGLALAMGATSPRLVTSGYFRVHLWVLLGLNTLASLAIFANRSYDHWTIIFGIAVGLSIASYVGAVAWLYEQWTFGRVLLFAIALTALLGAGLGAQWRGDETAFQTLLGWLDLGTSGWLLGVTMAAMLLGHWYLNTPTMEMLPLQRLVLWMGLAIGLRVAVSALGLGLQLSYGEPLELSFWTFVSLRWLSGLLATAVLTVMTWKVLQIPNTQSATGILYAGVILAFIGELTSQLLSVQVQFPL